MSFISMIGGDLLLVTILEWTVQTDVGGYSTRGVRGKERIKVEQERYCLVMQQYNISPYHDGS